MKEQAMLRSSFILRLYLAERAIGSLKSLEKLSGCPSNILEILNHSTLRTSVPESRVAPVSDRAVKWLNKYLDEARHEFVVDEAEDAFFITGYGTPFNPVYLGSWFSKVVKKVGINTGGSLHRLRHSLCTHLLENGCDIGFIAQIVGHEDISTTQIYTKVAIDSLEEQYRKFIL